MEKFYEIPKNEIVNKQSRVLNIKAHLRNALSNLCRLPAL